MQKNIALNVLIFLYINFGKLHLKEYLVGKCFGKFSKNLQNSQKFVPAKVKIRLKGLEGKILSFLLYIFINFMEKKPQTNFCDILIRFNELAKFWIWCKWIHTRKCLNSSDPGFFYFSILNLMENELSTKFFGVFYFFLGTY